MTGHKDECTSTDDDMWPRFLVIEAADGNHTLLTDGIDVFVLHKAIQGMGGPYKSLKPMNDGRQFLVHFETYSNNLLYKTDKLIDTPVKVTPHNSIIQNVWFGAKNWRTWT